MSTQQENPSSIGLVMYTDGSCMPNPGYGGWGIHGYKYTLDPQLKLPQGQKKNILSTCGYVDVNQLNDTVPSNQSIITPVKKLDTLTGYGTALTSEITNNFKMELLAIDKGLQWANEIHQREPIRELYILTDGKVAMDGLNHYYDKWVANNWLKQDGTEVVHKNEYIQTRARLDDLRSKISVQFQYVKGHSGNLGNTEADKLAKKGSQLAQAGKLADIRTVGKPNSKRPVSYHDFFTKNRWYFRGAKRHQDNPPKLGDWYVYYTGALGKGKSDSDFGVHCADGYSAMVLLKEQEPVLSLVEKMYRQQCQHKYDFIVYGNLTTVLTPDCYHDIIDHADQLVIRDSEGKTLSLPNDKVICAEYNPAHLSFIQMERYLLLQEMIEAYHRQDENIIVTDVKSDLVVEEPKKKETLYKLNPSVGQLNYIRVNINYGKEGKSHPVNITIKTDLPDKSHLSKLIKNHGKEMEIVVLSKMISPDAFRYCVAIKTPEAEGYWMNFDTALVYLA